MTQCGFVTVFGLTNAGKSTLVNRLVGAKVSIISHKVQTTRNRIMGVAMHGQSQIALIDTPGIFTAKRRLDRAMVDAAWQGINGSDMTMILVDSVQGFSKKLEEMLKKIKEEVRVPVILVLNKIDNIQRENLLALTQIINQHIDVEDVFMISALNGDGVDDLMAYLAEKMPQGPWHFPEDQLSDLPIKMLAAEITREKVYQYLHQELPYAIAIENDRFEEKKNGDIRIEQSILVQRTSQRAIVLGHKGQAIKKIGTEARKELEELLETKVHLFLQVRVKPDWSESRAFFQQWGLDFSV